MTSLPRPFRRADRELYRRSKNLERTIADVLASLTRLGRRCGYAPADCPTLPHVPTHDGKSLAIRRGA